MARNTTKPVERLVENLRSTRDLRAEILALAIAMHPGKSGTLYVEKSAISRRTIAAEWARAMPVLDPKVSAMMNYRIHEDPPDDGSMVADSTIALGRPNYCFEVVRVLLYAYFRGQRQYAIGDLILAIGASQTPIRAAVQTLQRNGLLSSASRGLRLLVSPEEMTSELLAQAGALPQRIKFRFARGAQIKTPVELLKRATGMLKDSRDTAECSPFSLSGVAVAQNDLRSIDVAGVPRLDLIARAPRDFGALEMAALRLIDDGLEVEDSILAPAPLVVTMVRADVVLERQLRSTRCAPACDVFLALLDIGFRDQAIDYVRRVRQ